METDPEGYVSSSPNTQLINLAEDSTANVNFGDMSPGNISGVVFEDKNGNGTQEPNESGVAGVTITLNDSQSTLISQTITNSDGTYLILQSRGCDL